MLFLKSLSAWLITGLLVSFANGFVAAPPPYHSTKASAYLLTTQLQSNSDNLPPTTPDTTIQDKIQSLLSSLDDNLDKSGGVSPIHSSNTVVHLLGTGISGSLVDLPLSSLALLSQANVVLYDSLSLSPEDIQRVVSNDCLVRSVAKRGGDANSVLQSEIDQLLVQYAQELPTGSTIVRLKGGDPLLFGRARTEVDALREARTRYKITPGLSSCVAGPHLAGIPLTDPILDSQSFAVFTGTDKRGIGAGDSEGTARDWANLQVDALVFLMIGQLPKLRSLCNSLIDRGGNRWTETTPCAVVQNAGRKDQQRAFRGTLHSLVEAIQEELGEEVTSISPAILVVGEVAALDLLDQGC